MFLFSLIIFFNVGILVFYLILANDKMGNTHRWPRWGKRKRWWGLLGVASRPLHAARSSPEMAKTTKLLLISLSLFTLNSLTS